MIDCLWPNTKKARDMRALNIWSDLFVVAGAYIRQGLSTEACAFTTTESRLFHNTNAPRSGSIVRQLTCCGNKKATVAT